MQKLHTMQSLRTCELGMERLDDSRDGPDNVALDAGCCSVLLMLDVVQSSSPLDGARCVAVGSWI